MAGEVEESFSMNFQADSIHSGSISFGRFENEPLSWERRSSFSHNRYLEEVEKCSKPGSVIEKKAYFEAHFKKKGLFGILPSAGHDGSERGTSETHGSERIGKQEDVESNVDHYVQFDQGSQEEFEENEDGHYVQIEKRCQYDFQPNEDDHSVQFDQRSQEDFEENEDGHYVPIEKRFQDDFEPNEDDHYIQFDQRSREDLDLDEGGHSVQTDRRSHEHFKPNEDDHYDQFGEILVDSDYQCGVNGYENDASTECPSVSFSISSKKSITNLNEAHQSENETSNVLAAHDMVTTEEKKDNGDTVNTDTSSINISVIMNEPCQGVEESILHDPVNLSPKVSLTDAWESKHESRLNSEVNNVRVRKSTSRSSKKPARTPSRENPRRTNMEKNLSKVTTPTTCSTSKTVQEVSKSVEKLTRKSKSENVSRVKKGSESQPLVLKTASKVTQESERLNRAFNSMKSTVRPRPSAFNFKSSERAERRKELYIKLEEKLQAKEAEMNQMQAVSQEKTQADIKKLRKSLNFKATPMPSFYCTTSPSHSQGNKAVSNNTRSKKLQNKSKCQGSGADAALPLKLNKGNDQSADDSATATEPHRISIEECADNNAFIASLVSPVPSTNHRSQANSVTNNCVSGKKERPKVAPKKQRVSDSCKGNKNGETTKHKNEITRKGVRNVGLRSSSRSGNFAVRVAS